MLQNQKFLGYSPEWIAKSSRLDVPEELPGIEEHSDLFGFPGVDALYTADGAVVPATQLVTHPEDVRTTPDRLARARAKYDRYFPPRQVIPQHFLTVDEPVTLVGHTPHHWGHFLLDGMARMWPIAIGAIDPARESLLFTARRSFDTFRQLPFVQQILRPLVVDLERVRRIEAPTFFRRVKIVYPSVNYSFRMFSVHSAAHRAVADRIACRTARYDRPIYISRRGFQSGTRTFAGEDVIENYAAARGFSIVHPERMPIPEQIAMFRQSPIIVGAIGSAFHSILFEPPHGDRLRVMLAMPRVNARFLMVDAINRGHTSWYLNVATAAKGRNSTTVIDADRAIGYLDKISL